MLEIALCKRTSSLTMHKAVGLVLVCRVVRLERVIHEQFASRALQDWTSYPEGTCPHLPRVQGHVEMDRRMLAAVKSRRTCGSAAHLFPHGTYTSLTCLVTMSISFTTFSPWLMKQQCP